MALPSCGFSQEAARSVRKNISKLRVLKKIEGQIPMRVCSCS